MKIQLTRPTIGPGRGVLIARAMVRLAVGYTTHIPTWWDKHVRYRNLVAYRGMELVTVVEHHYRVGPLMWAWRVPWRSSWR